MRPCLSPLRAKRRGADFGADGESTDAPETGDEISEVDSDPEVENAKVVTQSLRERSASRQHKLNHKTALSHDCDVCMIGKTKNARKYKGESERKHDTYGEIWTMDHVVMTDWFGQPGIGGYDSMLSVKDRATNRAYAQPVLGMTAEETWDENQIRGNDVVDRIYCDNYPSTRRLAK